MAELPQGEHVLGAVVLDVGECLVNETREYGIWTDWLRGSGCPPSAARSGLCPSVLPVFPCG